MPGDFRCDLTNACAFYRTHCTRGYRAHRAPGIPCALCFEGAGINEHLAQKACGEIVKSCLYVIASAAKQSISPSKERMDCFASLAMTVLSEIAESCTINSPRSTRPCAWRGPRRAKLALEVGGGGAISLLLWQRVCSCPPPPPPPTSSLPPL